MSQDEVNKTYNKISDKYHKVTLNNFYNAYLEVPAVSSLLKNVKNKKILDLGCGTGRHTIMLKNRGAKLWGIDPAKEMLEIAKSEIKGVDFKVGNASKLPYDNGFFDIVVAGLVIGYFKDLDKAFNEVNRVLKNGGIFVFSMTNPLLEVSEYDKKNKMCRKFNDYFKEGKAYANWPTFGVRIPYYHRTLQTIIRATIRSGFTIKDFVDAKPQNEARKVDLDSYLTYSKIPHFSIFKVRKTQ